MKFALCALFFASALCAAEVSVAEVWARATAPGMTTGAIFAQMTNAGGTAEQLTGAEIAPTIAERIELHSHTKGTDGVMRMAPVPAIDLPAGGKQELKPGSYHLMLFGLKQPLIEGQKIPLTLTFSRAGKILVTATVGGIADTSMPENCCLHK